VDPEVLIEEIDYLNPKGWTVGRDMLMISDRAHVIMPYHKLVDHGREKMKGEKRSAPPGGASDPATRTRPPGAGFVSWT
jgi:adenylosuccinate synthase